MLEQLKEDGRNERDALREEGRSERADKRIAAMLEAIDRRAAARDGEKGDKEGVRQLLGIVDSERKRLSEEATNARLTYQSELKSATGPTAKRAVESKWEPKLKELEDRRKAADEDYDFLRDKAGMPRRGTAKPAPSPAPAPGATPPAPAAKPTSAAPRPTTKSRDDSDVPLILQAELDTTRQRLAKATDPDEKRRLESDVKGLHAEAKRNGIVLKDSAAPAAPAAAAAKYKAGETRVVAAGPNKGKTVTWDGKGWKL
jgi:hypothetical protein